MTIPPRTYRLQIVSLSSDSKAIHSKPFETLKDAMMHAETYKHQTVYVLDANDQRVARWRYSASDSFEGRWKAGWDV